MEVETALPDRHHLRRAGQLAQLGDSLRVALLGVMRMYPDGGVYVLVAPRNVHGQPVALDRTDRANRNYPADAGLTRASENSVDGVSQLGVRQMAMGISERTRRRH